MIVLPIMINSCKCHKQPCSYTFKSLYPSKTKANNAIESFTGAQTPWIFNLIVDNVVEYLSHEIQSHTKRYKTMMDVQNFILLYSFIVIV